jgi:hypothetical protein
MKEKDLVAIIAITTISIVEPYGNWTNKEVIISNPHSN